MSAIPSTRPDATVLCDLYEEQRLTATAIGTRYGVHKVTAARWLKDAGISLRPTGCGLANRGIAAPTEPELRQMYERERLSLSEIATRYGVNPTTPVEWLKAAGIVRRQAGHPRRSRWADRPDGAVLRDMYEKQSLTTCQIGDQIGVADQTVAAWLREAGVEIRVGQFQPLPCPPADDLRRLYEQERLTTWELADHYDVAQPTILEWLKKTGIPTRLWHRHIEYTGQDGHRVRSSYEFRVCDWLTDHSIEHEYEPRLPWSTSRADFLANGRYVEIWGMENQKDYRARQIEKRRRYRRHCLPLLEIPEAAFRLTSTGKKLLERSLAPLLTPPQAEQLIFRLA